MMKHVRRTALLFALVPSLPIALAAVPCGSNDPHTLVTSYFRLHGVGGTWTEFQVDAAGQGNYGPNWITALRMGDTTLTPSQAMSWESPTTTSLVMKQVPVAVPRLRPELKGRKSAAPLWPGKRLGQRFEWTNEAMTAVGGRFPTWSSGKTAFTLSLRRDHPEGEVIASSRFRNTPDASVQLLRLEPPVTSGTYYLEMSEPEGSVGWYYRAATFREDRIPTETVYMTGKIGDEPVPMEMELHAHGYDVATADWEVSADGPDLRFKTLTKLPADTRMELVTPWIRDGYDTTHPQKIVFDHFLTDSGLYRPVHQFKRRKQQNATFGEWIEMSSRLGFRMQFRTPGQQVMEWEMEPDEMISHLGSDQAVLHVLPPRASLPSTFPAFYSSDPAFDSVLNQFLYSHGFNFGPHVYPDWLEWQTRILAWSDNPQKQTQIHYMSQGYRFSDDGYVWCWGAHPGWPFPHADDNNDGKNDYDTRHFTTNPGLVLGISNMALWTRDAKFVELSLPRARRAMDYMLQNLGGSAGLLLIEAPGHQGRSGGNGSNYWDILPFGHLDAYTNAYFYASLEAMARLEELAGIMKPGNGGRAPEEYRKLRELVRRRYRETFWDDKAGRFVGCVDADGVRHDYGFTFVNTEAMAYGLADDKMAERIYRWMETEPTASGQPDTYSRWIFAPRSATVYNPPHGMYNLRQDLPKGGGSWWHFGWRAGEYDDQCQAGGAILYTSYYDIMARARHLGSENAFGRFQAILDRYALPDHLSGGSPLFRGELSQGPDSGSVGVENEFPESGLVPSSFLYAFLGLDPKPEGLTVCPRLPGKLTMGGVKNLAYAGRLWECRITRTQVEAWTIDDKPGVRVQKSYSQGESVTIPPPQAEAAH